ncbi:hypothetical protein M1328_05515 [Patescibacteria group bacterium]|nr:hypothetical protein [Patescibacteria group bacterium]
MFNHRIRIVTSITIAFIFVILYGRLSTTPFIAPTETTSVKGLLANIKFPSLNLTKLFTLQFTPNGDFGSGNLNGGNGLTNLPTVALPLDNNASVNSSSNDQQAATDFNQPTSDIQPTLPADIPTQAIPVNTPKPTKTPKPTPLPPITSDTRPGTNLMGVFQEVSKYECIPAALIMAFKLEETGDWNFINDSASKIKIYNTYGWWQNGSGDSCYGYAYDTMTGIVPNDGYDAGRVCEYPIPASYDQQIMGLMQVSAYEQSSTRKYTSQVLPKNIDRRVLFDGALIFAVQLINRAGNLPMSCDSWPDSTIRAVAAKFHGSCQVTENNSGRNYCDDVINYYHQYSK